MGAAGERCHRHQHAEEQQQSESESSEDGEPEGVVSVHAD